MSFKHTAAALALGFGLSAAQAAILDFDRFVLDYDEGTVLNGLSGSFSSSDDIFGFNWNLPTALQVISVDGTEKSANFNLPSFTITAKPGWTLSGPVSGFLGNLSFVEVGLGSHTSATVSAALSLNGSPSLPAGGSINRVVLNSGGGNAVGYYGESATEPFGSFQTLSVSNMVLTLSAGGGIYAAITANEQNQLRFSLAAVAAPVPEPENWAMMLAGLGLLAGLARRRLRASA